MTRPAVVLMAAVASAFAAAVLLVPGCAGDTARQTEVVPEETVSKVETGSLTPLERGALRREIRRFAGEGMAAFLADDPAGIEKHFAKEYVEYWAKQRKENAAKGLVRVRKHSKVGYDVTTIDNKGTQALLEYYFVNDSYYAEASGAVEVPPVSGEEVMLQLSVRKTGDGWVIERMIGNQEATR